MASRFSLRHGLKISFAVVLSFAVIGVDDAAARAKRTRRPIPLAAVHAVLPQTPSAAHFFTINEVLAKRDKRAPKSPFVELAAAERKNTQTDALKPYMRSIASEPFDLMTFRAPPGLLWQKWRKLEADLHAEDKVITRCRAEPKNCAVPAAKRFIAIVDEARARSGRAKIDLINRAINDAVTYASDLAQYGTPDVWSAPLATFTTQRGDCEDYAIAKYVGLRDAGIGAGDLRILLVRDRTVEQDHAVLAVRDEGRWLILDNRHSMLNETAEVPQIVPLFALDQEGVKLVARPYAIQEWQRQELRVMPAAFDSGAIISRGSNLPLLF